MIMVLQNKSKSKQKTTTTKKTNKNKNKNKHNNKKKPIATRTDRCCAWRRARPPASRLRHRDEQSTRHRRPPSPRRPLLLLHLHSLYNSDKLSILRSVYLCGYGYLAYENIRVHYRVAYNASGNRKKDGITYSASSSRNIRASMRRFERAP